MVTKLDITVIVDNTAYKKLLGEHGLAMLIEVGDKTILFDTGKGIITEHNFNELGVDVSKITDLVLSHGHYDHTGGLSYLQKIPEFSPNNIFIHPDVLAGKYARNLNGTSRYIGVAENNREWLIAQGDKLHSDEMSQVITPLIKTTGLIPQVYKEENVKTPFYLDKELIEVDEMKDDQALFIMTEKGVVVVLGCCHRGLANTLSHISALTQTKSIYAVIGGTHLHESDSKRLEFTAKIVKEYDIKHFIPMHCTGFNAAAYLKNKFPDTVQYGHTGFKFTL
jgi:7,8-dihydropterin-6-yl-methyl-4-(beta-D-ribofuranosyl)aminobenzene 5'-phosphate synthase